MRKATIEQLITLVPELFSKDTAVKPDNWTPDNPSTGHCAIVALLVQENLGGEIERLGFQSTEWEKIGSHYRNRLPYGLRMDLTSAQFGNNYPPEDFPVEIRSRDTLLSNDDTRRRYQLFESRFNQLLGL